MANEEKGSSYLTILVPLSVVMLFLIAGYFVWQAFSIQNAEPVPMVCTQEALQCPDGSYVGRTGPRCEFTACPTTSGGINNKYTNTQFGFDIQLTDNWAGYSTFLQSWQGRNISTGDIQFEGPQVIIRNSQWSAQLPWQDIPIMVFTKDQWNLVESEQVSIGAAPIRPTKLGENQKYVFALPPRWVGFTNAQGQNEAISITQTFRAF